MKTLACLLFSFVVATAANANLPPLNSPASPEYHPGKFIWGDLFTDDPAAAEKFYTELFGWQATTVERTTRSGVHNYIVLSVGNRPVAGITRRPTRMKDQAHGRWVGYVSVPDVPKALATAVANGGRALSDAKDRPDRGMQAVFTDSEGALLGLMHSSSGDPGEYLPEPGDWCWAELFVRKPAVAAAFYRNLAGYDPIADTRPDEPHNLILASGGYSRASIAALSTRPKAHAVWLLFVRVSSVKETVARAVSLGGRVVVPPADTPKAYWRAVIADPSGAHIGVVELGQTGERP